MKIMRYALTAVLWLGWLAILPAATNWWYVATNLNGDGSSWALATNSIQGMIDDSRVLAGDTVWVSNGVYEAGGVTNFPAGTVLTNRIAINKAITVRSANNDPTNTIIKGAWDPATNGPASVRCVYMVDNSALIGFTLTNGATLMGGWVNDSFGAGVWSQSLNTIISNCVIAGNAAYQAGGGAYQGALFNCTLSGNSSAYSGGGARDCSGYNCTFVSNSVASYGGGTFGGTLSNCTLVGNSAVNGGGANGVILYNCLLSDNSASIGGGASGGTLYNCTLVGNEASVQGGGAYNSTLYNCTLSSNSAASFGGGVLFGTLNNCTLIGNSTAVGSGGGVREAALYNCLLVGNSAPYGGGTFRSTLYNCTIVGNQASIQGGGVNEDTLYNSIIYFNTAPNGTNWYGAVSFTNSCTTTAQVGWAAGNITADPLFVTNGSGYGTNHVAGNYRLSANSRCLNAGANFAWMTDTNDVRSKDLDGQPRIRDQIVDMGTYETLLAGTVFYFH